MVRLLFILLFPLTIFGQRPNGFGGFHHPYVRSITFDHTKVSTSSHTDFPVLISGTYSYLKTVANGGNVINANGYDIQFYSDAALTTKLKFEQERYVATTGEIQYWVKMPTLSNSSDDVIYMAYGQTGINTDQTDKNNVWNSAYTMVQHLKDGTTLSGTDATSNGNNLTNSGATASAGQIDGDATFDGSNDDMHISSFVVPTTGSFSCWWKPKTNPASTDITILRVYQPSPLGVFDMISSSGTFVGGWYLNGTDKRATWTESGISQDTYYKLDLTWTNGGTTTLYVNGVSKATTSTLNTTFSTSALTTYFGYDAAAVNYDNEQLDEVRFSNSVRTVGWIVTEYNNQSSPSTFYTISSPL